MADATHETARPSLSVCCMTAGPAGRIAALLELYRPLADEVFVAVDDRADEAVVAAAAASGARVVRYPYAEPVDRPLAWLHDECGGDWVLYIDDDEVPGAGLLDALPELVAADDVTHYWIPRRWLFPTPGRYLDEAPWKPDYQLRLVENDPRLLRFFEETHRPIEVVGPGRYIELPVYHADCVVNALERRAQKALKYERLRPGKRVAGGAMSHVFYLPERRPGARTADVPEDDLRLVRQVLDAPEPAAAPAPDVRSATREEIDRLWVGRDLPGSAHRAAIELNEGPGRLVAGEQRAVDARIENLGGEPWPWGELGRPEIRASYRWLAADGASVVVADGLRTPFPAPVAPGEAALVPVHVVAPASPGSYVLELDLVHEHVRWFGCSARVEVEVVPRRRAAVAGGGDALERVLERLAGADPELEPVVLAGDADGAGAGHRRAPSADAYLLEGAWGGRLLAAPRLALRTLALLRAARRARAGRPPAALPRGGGRFLEELRGAELLVLAGREPGTRGLWAAAATALAARALRVPVALEPSAAETGAGALDRALARLLARAARAGGAEAAAGEDAPRTG